jgi:hypothetical protein
MSQRYYIDRIYHVVLPSDQNSSVCGPDDASPWLAGL